MPDRDHRHVVLGLYRLIDDLLDLNYQLRKRSGLPPPRARWMGWLDESVDLSSLVSALDGLKGDEYPASVVQTIEKYLALKPLDSQEDVSRRLARIAWGVVVGEYTPSGGCRIAAKVCGSTATAAAVETALAQGTRATSEPLKVTRVYDALATGVPDAYSVGRVDAPPNARSPLRSIFAEVNPGDLRKWVELRDRAEREGKSIMRVLDEAEREGQPAHWIATHRVVDGVRIVDGMVPATDTRSEARVSKRLSKVGSECPTTDKRRSPGAGSTRPKKSKKK